MEERRERELEMGAMTLSRMRLIITMLSIKDLYVTLSINETQHKNTAITLSGVFYLLLCYAECHYAKCCYANVVMMSVVAPRN